MLTVLQALVPIQFQGFGWELHEAAKNLSVLTAQLAEFAMRFCISLSYLSTRKRAVKPRTETPYYEVLE